VAIVLLFLMGYFIRRSRHRRKPDKNGSRILDSLPLAMARESTQNDPVRETQMVETGLFAPSFPSRSQNRIVESHSAPPRPPRPSSLTNSIVDIMRTPPSGSYLQDTNSEKSLTPFESSSQHAIGFRYLDFPLATPPTMFTATSQETSQRRPQAYDGTRNLFYETALNRKLPFNQLTRPSLRISDPKDIRHKSLTPKPLRIVKSNTSDPGGNNQSHCPTVLSPQSEHPRAGERGYHRGITPTERGPRGIVQQPQRPQAASDPLVGPPHQRQPLRQEQSDTGTLDLMSSNEDGAMDEEEILSNRENTYRFLEGVLPMSPPRSVGARASSVNSHGGLGTYSPNHREGGRMERDNAADRRGRDREGKRRERDGEVGCSKMGGNWL
jgi:hypothetical protein